MKNKTLSIAAALLTIMAGVVSPATGAKKGTPPKDLSKIPNKVALANWVKPRTAKAKTGSVNKFNSLAKHQIKAASTGSTQKFRCGILYSDSWDDDNYQYGAYSFTIDNVNNFTCDYLNTSAPANAGGFFTDEGKYIFTSYIADDYGWDYNVTTYVVNLSTGKIENTYEQESLYAMASDLTYDPIEKKAFGSFYSGDDNGSYWGFMDPESLEVTQIAELEGSLVAVAANASGEIYAITSGGYLVKVDKYSGTLTTIGNTNATPYYMQSAAFDEEGTLYWAAGFSDGSTGLFKVDTETAHISLVEAWDNEEEVVSLYCEPKGGEPGSPAEPTGLSLNFVEDALSGTLMFTIPSVDNQGEAMSGLVNYTVSVDSSDVATGSAEVGAEVSVPVSVETAGVHSFNVRLSNTIGESKRVSVSQWVGIDRPVAVGDLQMEKTGVKQATITWTAPTQGALGGYFDQSRVTYTVTRLPEGKVVASGLRETQYVDNIDTDTKVYLTYKVTPYADDVAGTSAVSNGAVFGDALVPPVEFTFDTEADYNLFTIIDNNETANLDSGMWQYTASGECAGYVCGTEDGDDWLITPEIKLQSDRQYTLTYDVLCYSDYWPDEYELYMGNDATIAAMTTQLVEPTTIYWDEYRTKTVTITVEKDGTYNFGFHALSEAGGAFFLVDNIKLVESYKLKSPAAVSEFAAVAGAKGDLSAEVSFVTPTEAVDGSALESLTSVKVYRDNALVKEFSAPAPGTKLTYNDSDLDQGWAKYKVIAENEIGEGVESEQSIWIGFDTPVEPENVNATVVNGHPVITWDAAPTVGQNGGYVDNTQLTYIVYRAADSKILAYDYEGFSYTDEATDVSTEGAQHMLQYYVFAQSTEGIGSNGTAYVLDGKPYDMPFSESFAGGSSDRLWISSATYDDYWSITNEWSADPQDGDKGLLLLTPYTPGSESTILSGKIDMLEAKNATMQFYMMAMTYMDNDYAETDPKDDYLEVVAATSDYRLKTLKTIYPNDLKKGEYLLFSIPMNEFDGKEFVQFGFKMHSVAAQSPLAIDNIKIINNFDDNARLADFSVPAEVNVTENFTASVTVQNDGANAIDSYTVSISRGEEELASLSVTSAALAAGESETRELELTAEATWGSSETLVARVTMVGDENSKDDTAEATVKILRPEMPEVSDLNAEVSADDTVVFTWTAPEISDNKKVEEDFESYSNGQMKNVGEWTLRDEDGVYGVDDMYTDSGTYINIPHPFSMQAFQVVDPEEMDIDLSASPEWASHSGNKMLVSFRNWEGDNDDWAITPELSGKAQTFSFWARSPKNGTDKIIVYSSTTDTAESSFDRLDEGRITLTNEWTQYSFELPAGVKYVAIRNSQANCEAVMIDDVVFEAASQDEVKAEVLGYNLYRENEKVNEEVITDTTYTVVDPVGGNYYVTVVYNVGESAGSNVVKVSTSGVVEVSLDAEAGAVYDLFGRKVQEMQNGQVYVRKGEKFVYRNK